MLSRYNFLFLDDSRLVCRTNNNTSVTQASKGIGVHKQSQLVYFNISSEEMLLHSIDRSGHCIYTSNI